MSGLFRPAACRSCMLSIVLVAGVARAHVMLDSPNGGEVYAVDEVVSIEWHVVIQHNLLDWDLWYSVSGPAGPWVVLAEDLPAGDGAAGAVHTHDWIVPNAPSTQVFIRVRQDNLGGDYEDISDAPFSIDVADIPGDTNGDGDVDLGDYAEFPACVDGTGDPDVCVLLDGNHDGIIDLQDFRTFQLNYTGP